MKFKFNFCWHRWPLYGTEITKQEFVKGWYAWFRCFKCGKLKLKKCTEHGMRK